jgi:hypothetical protein
MKALWRKPDLVLALIVGEVCVAASIWQAITFLRTGGGATLYPEPSRIVLAYIVFECIRQARPLTGAVVGAYGVALWLVPRSVAELVYSWAFDIVWGTPAIIGVGAVIGLAVATLSWLVGNWLRRKRPTADVVPEPLSAPKPAGWVLVLAALLVLAPLAESLGWAFQADFRVALGLWEHGTGPWHGWGIFYRLDRTLTMTLASLAAYGMLGRRRWMRSATVTYLVVGLLVTAVRLVFFRTLPADLVQSGSTTPIGTGYANANLFMLTPAVAVESLVRLNVIDAVVRAIACLVGIPYVLRSRKLTEFLQRTRPPADS